MAIRSPNKKESGHEYAHEESESAHPRNWAQETENEGRNEKSKPKPSLEISQSKAHGAMSPYTLLRRLDHVSFHQHSQALQSLANGD